MEENKFTLKELETTIKILKSITNTFNFSYECELITKHLEIILASKLKEKNND